MCVQHIPFRERQAKRLAGVFGTQSVLLASHPSIDTVLIGAQASAASGCCCVHVGMEKSSDEPDAHTNTFHSSHKPLPVHTFVGGFRSVKVVLRQVSHRVSFCDYTDHKLYDRWGKAVVQCMYLPLDLDIL